jgi:AraC-like DNA-binding protein
VRFAWDYDGIVCRAADLEKAIPASDPAMARYLKEYFDSILPSPRAEVSETVRELMWVMLKSGSCSAERVAKHLGVDRRTVNRRLASEGQSYSSILDAVRRDMVRNLVEHGQRPLNEIASMLGFSGLSAFPRLVQEPFWAERIGMARGTKHPRYATEPGFELTYKDLRRMKYLKLAVMVMVLATNAAVLAQQSTVTTAATPSATATGRHVRHHRHHKTPQGYARAVEGDPTFRDQKVQASVTGVIAL